MAKAHVDELIRAAFRLARLQSRLNRKRREVTRLEGEVRACRKHLAQIKTDRAVWTALADPALGLDDRP